MMTNLIIFCTQHEITFSVKSTFFFKIKEIKGSQNLKTL